MASSVPKDWKGHLYISLSELCFVDALCLLINNRSNFLEKPIIVRKIKQIIVRKLRVNHRTKRIIVLKVTRIEAIVVPKMPGNFIEISFQAKFLQKAPKSQEFHRNSFALLLHNIVLHQAKRLYKLYLYCPMKSLQVITTENKVASILFFVSSSTFKFKCPKETSLFKVNFYM